MAKKPVLRLVRSAPKMILAEEEPAEKEHARREYWSARFNLIDKHARLCGASPLEANVLFHLCILFGEGRPVPSLSALAKEIEIPEQDFRAVLQGLELLGLLIYDGSVLRLVRYPDPVPPAQKLTRAERSAANKKAWANGVRWNAQKTESREDAFRRQRQESPRGLLPDVGRK